MQSFVTCFFTQPLFRITLCVFLPIPPTNGHFRFFCLFVLPFRTVLLVYIFDIFSCKCARYSGHMPPKWNFRQQISILRDFRYCQIALKSGVQVCTPSGIVRGFWNSQFYQTFIRAVRQWVFILIFSYLATENLSFILYIYCHYFVNLLSVCLFLLDYIVLLIITHYLLQGFFQYVA